MRYITFSIIVLSLCACSKKEICYCISIILKNNPCHVASINANNQNSDDFFVLKTYNEYGKITHLKTKIRELHTEGRFRRN